MTFIATIELLEMGHICTMVDIAFVVVAAFGCIVLEDGAVLCCDAVSSIQQGVNGDTVSSAWVGLMDLMIGCAVGISCFSFCGIGSVMISDLVRGGWSSFEK